MVKTPLVEAIPSVLSGVTACVKMLVDRPLSPHCQEIPKVLLYGGVVTGRFNVDGSQVRIPSAFAYSQNAPSNFMVEDFVLEEDVLRRYTFPYSDSSMTVDDEVHMCMRNLLMSKSAGDIKKALEPMDFWVTQAGEDRVSVSKLQTFLEGVVAVTVLGAPEYMSNIRCTCAYYTLREICPHALYARYLEGDVALVKAS